MSGGGGEPVISYLRPLLSGEHGGAEACPSSLPHNKARGRRSSTSRKIRQTREGRTSLLKSVSAIFDIRIYFVKETPSNKSEHTNEAQDKSSIINTAGK